MHSAWLGEHLQQCSLSLGRVVDLVKEIAVAKAKAVEEGTREGDGRDQPTETTGSGL